METTYNKTLLWKRLKKLAPKHVNAKTSALALEASMADIETVLGKGVSLKNFTLHDQDHSFRVAERMAAIIPDDVLKKLSVYELAMLLFAAYLHDIGMTPEYSKLEQHFKFIRGEPDSGLSDIEREDFSRWMDEEERTLSPENADELVTYYCRHKHNEWSGEWTRTFFKNGRPGLYDGWVDDLVTICQSHHEGYDELIKNRFNPIIRDSIIHLRYLSAVLRVADILEFDPERTPKILFRHRQVGHTSRIYWLKDHQVILKADSKQVRMQARPACALVHRAIEQMIHDIDRELLVCRDLSAQRPFAHNPADPNNPLPHHWDLEPRVLATWQPKEEGGRPIYEYIDGVFRPDTRKLLDLLAGIELYSTPLAAIRELLQNAFDAVNERIARERLSLPDPLDPKSVKDLQNTHGVKVIVEKRDGRVYLVCTDNGVGMSKAVIRDYLLVSGRNRRPELNALARRCAEKKFSIERSGKFGIGVLSYFMLADRLIIRTLHNEGEGAEAVGWRFETDGVGSFGELRPDPQCTRGTEVTLRIRRDVVEEIAGQKFNDYLGDTLLHVPCRVESQAPGSPFSAGWARSVEAVADLTIAGPLKSHLPGCREQLRFETCEAELSSGLGVFRLLLPYFELPTGASLAYFFDSNGIQPDFVRGSDPDFRFGWRGMTVASFSWNNNATESLRYVHGEVDWRSETACKIAVNRNELTLSEEGQKAVDWLQERVKTCFRDFLTSHSDSPYHVINCHLADLQAAPAPAAPSHWMSGSGASLQSVCYPAATNLGLTWCLDNADSLAWNGKPIMVLPPLEIKRTSGSQPDRVSPKFEIMMPTAVVAYRPAGARRVPGIAALFEKQLQLPRATSPGVTCAFPPRWKSLAAVEFTSPGTRNGVQWLYNLANPVVKQADAATWAQIRSGQTTVAFNLTECSDDWFPLCLWHEDPSRPRLTVYRTRADKKKVFDISEEVSRYLPSPGLQWSLTQRT